MGDPVVDALGDPTLGALYRAVVRAPADDTPRLAYADYLDDLDPAHPAHDPARSALIRAQVKLAGIPDTPPACRPADRRRGHAAGCAFCRWEKEFGARVTRLTRTCSELESRHRRRWTDPGIYQWGLGYAFERGFVGYVDAPWARWRSSVFRCLLFSAYPVVGVAVVDAAGREAEPGAAVTESGVWWTASSRALPFAAAHAQHRRDVVPAAVFARLPVDAWGGVEAAGGVRRAVYPDAHAAYLALSTAVVRWGREAAGIVPPFRKPRKAGGGDPDD